MKGPWKGDWHLSTTWRYSSGAAHFAWDVACPRGTDLYAIGDGEIVDCADGQPDPAPRRYSGMPSNWIILRFTFPSGPYRGKTGYAYYQHLTKGGVKVHRGQKVKKGQYIGESGSSGNSTGPHLHLVVLKPGYSMNRGSRYAYMGNPSSVVWPLNRAWEGTTYSGGVASSGSSGGGGPTIYLRKLHYGQRDSDSVKALKKALKKHVPAELADGIDASGNYGSGTDAAVRWCQQKHGFGHDPVGGSSVGVRQAKHLGLQVQ